MSEIHIHKVTYTQFKMKSLLQKWNEILSEEAEEMTSQNKSTIFKNVDAEANNIVNKIKTAAAGDSGLAKEAMQSLIVALQNSIESL